LIRSKVRPRSATGLTCDNVAESIKEQIVREVSGWPGVTVAPHRFGGVEFRHGRRELGHLHGSRLADLPFPVRVREELVAAGKASRHHILPQSGWVSYYIRDESDAARVIELFRFNYERPWSDVRT
jgi:Luciferase